MIVSVNVEIFEEDDVYVAFSPELNISSFGDTIDEARSSFRDALSAFVHTCGEMGTLQEVLEEAGFIRRDDLWAPRIPIVAENLAVAV